MAIRNHNASQTFEEWRVEFNELAVDVGDIGAGITGTTIAGTPIYTSAETSLEGIITDINGLVSGTSAFDTISFEGATDDDFETTISGYDVTQDRALTLPNADGVLGTEGYAIAVAIALG